MPAIEVYGWTPKGPSMPASMLSPRAMGEFVVRLTDVFGLDQPHAVGLTAAHALARRLTAMIVTTLPSRVHAGS